MKTLNIHEEDYVLIIMGLIILAYFIFFIGKMEENNPTLSGDEICQKHFGKDYVWQNGGRSADFCVGDSGIPKYPKTWSERRYINGK
nr:MAG TPA: hypothetical protein [Caudoviricetes sp.]